MSSSLHPGLSSKRSHSDLSRSVTPVPPEADNGGPKAELPDFLRQARDELQQKFKILGEVDRERIESYFYSLISGRGSDSERDAEHPWASDRRRETLLRNRYADIFPYSKTRVRLQAAEGDSDYINASPVELSATDGITNRRYIATQGPKADNVNHFWQMVWHECQQTAVIVMLTQLFEGGREKCFQYYPVESDAGEGPPRTPVSRASSRTGSPPSVSNINLSPRQRQTNSASDRPSTSSKQSGSDLSTATQPSLSVALTSESGQPLEGNLTLIDTHVDETALATVRKLSLTCGSDARIIYHLQFTGWPDFSVPTGTNRAAMLSLIHLSNEKNDAADDGGPRVVHCSAGVGRTGTFIALEHLLGEISSGAWDEWNETTRKHYLETHTSKNHSDIAEKEIPGIWPDPVFDTVARLREQRASMVQAVAQYLFIYEVLAEEWLKRRIKALEDKKRLSGRSPKVMRLGGSLKRVLSMARPRGSSKTRAAPAASPDAAGAVAVAVSGESVNQDDLIMKNEQKENEEVSVR